VITSGQVDKSLRAFETVLKYLTAPDALRREGQ
jgi:hypothetical protein